MSQTAHAPLRSFGRRRGRKLRKSRSDLVEKKLPALLINLEHALPLSHAPLWVEIGFGAGEHLVEQAKQNPKVQFIGCEPYINGTASLLAQIEQHTLSNIRLFDNDARLLLEKLPDHSIEKLFVLFPDPWPKARHHKKRLISQDTLALFHRKLARGGMLRIATDHVDYGTWMLENLLAFQKFEWQATSQSDWASPPAGWIKTRYQQKAENEGRSAIFLDWAAW